MALNQREYALEEQVVQLLLEKRYTVTTAESCTGGLLAGRLMNVPGISAAYKEGYITYSNEAKEKLLNVSHETLETEGAVSEETAYEMALGAARSADANVALATTGIAGPDGGTMEKPVGLVYIACNVNGDITVERHLFAGERAQVRELAVEKALQLAKRMLKDSITIL